MIRVLVISETWPPSIGGGAVHAAEICARLSKQSCRVTVIKGGLSENLFVRCWFVVSATIRGFFVPADIIQAHAFLGAVPGKILSVLRGLPIVLTVHGTRLHTSDTMGHGLADSLFRWLEERILLKTKYDAQISVDRRFFSLRNVNDRRFVIPNGGDVRLFDRQSVKKVRPPAILFVGRLHPQKGLPYLLKAFVRLRRNIDTQLWIVGSGPEEKLLRTFVDKHNIKQDVTFFGPRFGEELVKIYKQASVFVLPSLYEGSPLTLFEAWAAKLPVVVTEVGDNKRVVKDGKNGFVVPPKDIDALSRALTRVLTFKLSDRLGESGHRLVKGSYTWDKAARATLNVYKEVLHAES